MIDNVEPEPVTYAMIPHDGSLSDVLVAITCDERWRYGFPWGPMTVSRLCHIEGRGYVLEIKTDHAALQVYITEKGHKIQTFPQPPPRRQDAAPSTHPTE